MEKDKIIVIGEKESFLIRVLVKKLIDSGLNSVYAQSDVNAINAEWEDVAIVVYYAETDEAPHKDVLQFLNDKLNDEFKKIIIIGEKNDVDTIKSGLSSEVIYKEFYRPLDNDKFVSEIKSLLLKIASGELQKHILIVDDDPTFLNLMRQWLKGNYKLSFASSGLQAIKWLGKNKADLILLDYEMPVTSGPQVLEMLRSDDETKTIPVIFLTGKGDKESVMSVVALKPEGYFLKNIEREELLDNLEKFFMSRKV